ncbi:MAG: hypothetical protein AAFR05_22350, partial [Bacteroidota bacterium]
MKNYLLLFVWLLIQQTPFAQHSDPDIPYPSSTEWTPELSLGLDDISQKVLDSIVEVNHGTSPNYISSRIKYGYDSEGHQIRFISLNYSSAAPYPISFGQRVLTEFSANEEVRVSQLWEGGEWQNSSRWTSILDSDGRVVESSQESWPFGGVDWENNERSTYNYDDATDQLLTVLVYDWMNYNWVLSQRFRRSYNADGLLSKLEIHDWNSVTQEWKLDRETDYTYDGLQQLTARLTFALAVNGMDLYLQMEERFFYNGDTQLDSSFLLRTIPNTPVFGLRNHRFYESSTVSYDTTFRWDLVEENWLRTGYSRLERDDDGDLQTIERFSFDPDTGLPILARTRTYYYSQLNVGTTAPAPQSQLNCLLVNPHPGPQTVTCSKASEPVRDIVARVYDLQGRLHWSRPLQAQGR